MAFAWVFNQFTACAWGKQSLKRASNWAGDGRIIPQQNGPSRKREQESSENPTGLAHTLLMKQRIELHPRRHSLPLSVTKKKKKVHMRRRTLRPAAQISGRGFVFGLDMKENVMCYYRAEKTKGKENPQRNEIFCLLRNDSVLLQAGL